MTTLALDSPLVQKVGNRDHVPVIADDIVFEGAMLGDNASGYGQPLVAGNLFRGHAIAKCDNTGGAAGAKYIEVLTGRYRLEVSLVGLITDVGQPVYASDDAVYTFAGAGNSYIGVITRYVSATRMEIECRPGEYDEFGNNSNRVLKSADYTTLLADSGKIIYVDTDAKIISLVAIATGLSGYEITIANGAGFGVAGIVVDPNSTEVISGGCALGPGAGGKKFTNTKTTAQRNDFIKLAGNATGWNIINLRGTWAIES